MCEPNFRALSFFVCSGGVTKTDIQESIGKALTLACATWIKVIMKVGHFSRLIILLKNAFASIQIITSMFRSH